MTRQIVLRPPGSIVDRLQPLLSRQEKSSSSSSSSTRNSKRVAEVVGGTTAECAAICCCCPFALVNLFFLAVYKVPAGLYRKALRRRRRRKVGKTEGFLPRRNCGCSEMELVQNQIQSVAVVVAPFTAVNLVESDKDVVEMEKEMWDMFYSAGFWRSLSQKST